MKKAPTVPRLVWSLAPWAGIKNEGSMGSDRMNRMHGQRQQQLILLGVRRERLDVADPQSSWL